MQYSYYVNDNGVMTIYANDMTVADISDCGKMNPKELTNLMYEVLNDNGYEV